MSEPYPFENVTGEEFHAGKAVLMVSGNSPEEKKKKENPITRLSFQRFRKLIQLL